MRQEELKVNIQKGLLEMANQTIFKEAVAEERRLIDKDNNVRADFVRDYYYDKCRELGLDRLIDSRKYLRDN